MLGACSEDSGYIRSAQRGTWTHQHGFGFEPLACRIVCLPQDSESFGICCRRSCYPKPFVWALVFSRDCVVDCTLHGLDGFRPRLIAASACDRMMVVWRGWLLLARVDGSAPRI